MIQKTLIMHKLIATFAFILVSFLSSQAQAKTLYVSAESTGTTMNGLSPDTAWHELNQIDWSKVLPGDQVEIGFGIYHTGVKVGASGTAAAPIRIVTPPHSTTNARFGERVAIYGIKQDGSPATEENGIDFNNRSYVTLEGNVLAGSNDIVIFSFRRNGIVVPALSRGITVRGVGSGGHTEAGVLCRGVALFDKMAIGDNGINIRLESRVASAGATFRNSHIVNTNYINERDGVLVASVGGSSYSHNQFNNCVFGPGLNTAIQQSQAYSQLSLTNCLFINPKTAVIKKSINYLNPLIMTNITSYLTPLNDEGKAHSFLSNAVGGPYDRISNSIVYGGAITFPGNRSLGTGNFQFKTSGNTMVISAGQVDPKFQVDVEAIGKLTFPNNYIKLLTADFALQSNSPAIGRGSAVTSSAQLFR
jgi:hypothetical protein